MFNGGKFNSMSATQILEQIHQLPLAEQYEVAEKVREEYFEDEPTPEQLAEFDRRGDELRRNPASGIPWETVRAEMKERIKARSCNGK
jgi:putative addiction module component (TIGR02574 family)